LSEKEKTQEVSEKKAAVELKQSTMGEIFQFNTGFDKFIMAVGLLFAVISGFGMPSFIFLFKDLTSGFGTDPSSIDALYDCK
jgi:hypothetical protein